MHRLLQRQLKRQFGEQVEFSPAWRLFLDAVDEAYRSTDSHREMLERALVLSTREVHQANAEMRAIFQAIPDLLFRVDRDGTIRELKAGTDSDLVIPARDLIGKKIQGIPNPKVAAAFRNCLEPIGPVASLPIEYSLEVKEKANFYEARFVPLLGDQLVVIIQNVTKRKQRDALIEEHARELQRINAQLEEEIQSRHLIEERLRYDATHDRLTGLPNRANMLGRLERCLELSKRNSTYQFALLFIDLDDFKLVNDTLGHQAGDSFLTWVAERLSLSIRSVDTASRSCIASRLGGDEFVVILEGITSPSDALCAARRIQQTIEEPCIIEGHELTASMSIGIAVGRPEYKKPADVLRDADAAVYCAKREGKNRIVMHEEQASYVDAPILR